MSGELRSTKKVFYWKGQVSQEHFFSFFWRSKVTHGASLSSKTIRLSAPLKCWKGKKSQLYQKLQIRAKNESKILKQQNIPKESKVKIPKGKGFPKITKNYEILSPKEKYSQKTTKTRKFLRIEWQQEKLANIYQNFACNSQEIRNWWQIIYSERV